MIARVVETFSLNDAVEDQIEDFCEVGGLTVDYTYARTGTGTVRERGRSALPYFMGHTRVVETFSYGGRTVTGIANHQLEKDLRIEPNDDGTWSVLVLLTGPQRVVNQEGRTIARNDGQIRVVLTYDPVVDEVVAAEVVFGSTGTNDDVCAAMLADLGL